MSIGKLNDQRGGAVKEVNYSGAILCFLHEEYGRSISMKVAWQRPDSISTLDSSRGIFEFQSSPLNFSKGEEAHLGL